MLHLVFVPARQASSHCASVGSAPPTHLANNRASHQVKPVMAGSTEERIVQEDQGKARVKVLSADGSTLYVAAYGSSKIGVFSTAARNSS